MSDSDIWYIPIPGRPITICPECRQLVGKGAQVHHSKFCFKKREVRNGSANGEAGGWQMADLRHDIER